MVAAADLVFEDRGRHSLDDERGMTAFRDPLADRRGWRPLRLTATNVRRLTREQPSE